MEEEADGCRNRNKRLAKFLCDSISNDVFDIRADIGIVIFL
jgi:hypothetical protein